MMILLGLLFLVSMQPIFMVGSLIFITLFYSLYLYKVMGSYWFSYVLVMIMLSGVLVVFTYMVSLFPNESFEMYNLFYIIFVMLLFIKMNVMNYGGDFSLITLNLWFSYVGMFNLFLVSFLLLIMLMVVWVSCVKEGAVRVYMCAWLKG